MKKMLRKFSHLFSAFNRRRKLRYIEKFIESREIDSCLVVGAAQTNARGYGNLIERGLIEICENVVISGIEEYGIGWDSWVSCDGRDLPYQENEFDFVFSNAVIEHVGFEDSQFLFVAEHMRVGKHWMFTTPNRLFPIESHTQILFRHMNKSWSHPLVTRLLSRKDIENLIPRSARVKGRTFSPTFIVHCGC